MTGTPVNKVVDLEQLKDELAAAGITVGALGRDADSVFTYNAAGQATDLPNGSAAVVAAHTPTTPALNTIVSLVQSTVGIAAPDLTTAQRNALMLALLYKAGGVNPRTLAIKPLNQWLD